ncbi:MAG: response regulator, partial [SAR324 cluster bacterium]|nr:response regulator [SAR324 cluster bacterium]
MSAIIMTVDDSRTIRGQVRRTLEQQTEENYSIVEKGDGLEALRWLSNCLRKDLPDVIVLDRNMPNMSGDECIRILKQDDDWKKIPVLFLTAQTDIKQLVLGLAKLGADDYLPKPFDFDELAARVKVMVRIKQAEDESRRLNKDLELSLIQQQKAFEELKTTKMRLAETEAAAKLTAVFEKFVPKEFIKRIAPDGLEFLKFGKADTDFISILFCDIRSFTSLSEKMTPQELVDFLNDFFKRMTAPISQNKGFVDKFIGDCVMALFSIPEEPNDTDGLNSVMAAISMQEQIDSFNVDNNRSGDNLLRVGVGIHSGPVIIGTVGSEERMESTVTGDTVNMAARLEGLTKFYRSKILISQSTHDFIQHESNIESRELDLVQVKGKEEPVTIFEVCNSDLEPIREQKLGSREKFAEALTNYRSQKW